MGFFYSHSSGPWSESVDGNNEFSLPRWVRRGHLGKAFSFGPDGKPVGPRHPSPAMTLSQGCEVTPCLAEGADLI